MATYAVTSADTRSSANVGGSHFCRALTPVFLSMVFSPSFSRFSGRSREWESAGQGECDQRAAVARAEHSGDDALEPATPADRHDDVLLAVDAVRRGAAVVAATTLELPQLFTGASVERDEFAGRRACEHEVACGGEHRCGHRVVEAPAPLLLAVAIERADRTGHVVDVHLDGSAPVGHALLELPTPTRGGGARVRERHVRH